MVVGRLSDWFHWNPGDFFCRSAFHLMLMESLESKFSASVRHLEVRDNCATDGVRLSCLQVSGGNLTLEFAIMILQRK